MENCGMPFESIQLEQVLVVNRIVTVHYFEYFSNFSFPGEAHNFWELLCVDTGEVIATAENNRHVLKKGDIIFHKPNEFHRVDANGRIAPNLIVISFFCNSKNIRFFENKVLTIGDTERLLFAQIIREARNTYRTPLNDPYFKKLERLDRIPFGSEQLIKVYLEQILISLIRKHQENAPEQILPYHMRKDTDEVYEQLLTYLGERLQMHLSLEEICRDNLIGRSQLQRLFQIKNHCGVIEQFCRMKIEAAKQMIRENHLNFTEIADALGYSSVHYFSRQFKKIVGLTPSQYASSIKSLSEIRE